jgi:hypothetical protein
MEEREERNEHGKGMTGGRKDGQMVKEVGEREG